MTTTTQMIELDGNAYDTLWQAFTDLGAKLYTGKHEGSTLQLGRLLLCTSDGAFWLDVLPSEPRKGEDR
jgi:hypothetical protein